ncbi:metallophosphoesterase [Microbacterium sp. APC 3898]|uniref:Phosphoesterase n=2 Tax=Planococcus TaxID=1372 RepID=A0ABT7ZLD1_9BACL|nr:MULTISPECIES: metallophosphoesterase [Terrabacteria group]MBF6633474.1 metallophosphoesterase [Planococcus sp. (in: firmicutes)]MBD8014973.1 metallophosphoesterase [Planococcus wigleyi]MDN3427960.1 metallophosphoesterase [Planococcus sp. APC 4016]MDN3439087.1 metallophosphoesterase [Planococcus sp. APC 3900]MDN3498505.1 metallophosphoesterase [Microbacterium sp. APC 3898]
MKKIVIVSDTHVPFRAKKLPQKLVDACQEADFIIHAGDWQTMDVYHELAAYADIDGVTGNVDPWDILDKFGRKKIFTFGDLKIGVVHGDSDRKPTEKQAFDTFANDDVDIIVFGHSHTPIMREVEGITLFNPGSPTDKRRQEQYSFGLLEIGDSWELKHVFFDKES